jgi:hypothetical protein
MTLSSFLEFSQVTNLQSFPIGTKLQHTFEEGITILLVTINQENVVYVKPLNFILEEMKNFGYDPDSFSVLSVLDPRIDVTLFFSRFIIEVKQERRIRSFIFERTISIVVEVESEPTFENVVMFNLFFPLGEE